MIKIIDFKKHIFLFLIFFIPVIGTPQIKSVIIKLKHNTPQIILNNFRYGFPSQGNNSIAELSKELNINKSKQVFEKILPELKANEIPEFGLDKIYVIEINAQKVNFAVNLLSRNEYVEYIEPNYVLKLENIKQTVFIPDDPYFSYQYYFNKTGLPDVWNITRGDSSVLIGVVDSGLDFIHPDLKNSFRINYGEYGNGKESNGIDDDLNGFIDDWRGWDFVDQPETGDPARGDYLMQDNDPTDDNIYSHGTAVSGLINAGFNNGTGISSVAPDVKILVMRAFDAMGYGEEDDVASAILYGTIMGVKIFNFSFGDYIYTQLLRDVIRYAYSKNITIITSAGNDGSDRLHYPSAFDEVISVGASDELDRRTSFSSFGETVDLFAPGSGILSTSRKGKGSPEFNNDYLYSNGTSFSAPIVSATAGLLLSLNKNLSNEEIRGILVSNTNYFQGQTLWNHNFSSGIMNAFYSVTNVNYPSIARVFLPYQDLYTDKDTLPLFLSAASSLFKSYSVSYGIGQKPDAFINVTSEQYSQVLKDTVSFWNVSSLPDTSLTLKLAVNNLNGRTVEHRLILFKDKSVPVITSFESGDLIDKDNYSRLVLFSTVKPTIGKIFYKRKNINEGYNFIYADNGSGNSGLISNLHFGFLKSSVLYPSFEYVYYIEAQSLNGKTTILNDSSFRFTSGKQIELYGYNKKDYTLPKSQVCNTVTDINNNGKKDILVNGINNNLRLNVYEFSNGSFTKISNDNWSDYVIARDIGDVNNNGKIDLLTSKGRNGALFEAPQINQLPTGKIWSDEENDNFWSARIYDTDLDGKKEIIGFGKTGLRILESNGGGEFIQIANLSYSGASSVANSQNVIIEDFNGDGKNEIFFIDLIVKSSGDILLGLNMYKNTGNNSYNRIVIDSLYREIKADNITAGDFDGDGKKEFALGTVSRSNDLIQYYSLYVFRISQNDGLELIDVSDIYNYKSYTETSTHSSDIDNDGKDEIVINTGTYFYIMKYDNVKNKFYPSYFRKNINTTNQIIYDFDNNNIREIGLNSIDDSLLFIEKDISFTGPQTPLNFNGFSVDSNCARLEFYSVINADYYRIYRSADTIINFMLYDSTVNLFYDDLNVQNRKNYYYKISAVDTNNIIKESKHSDYIKIYTHNKSKLLNAYYEKNGFLTAVFSERIKFSIPQMSSFIVSNGIGNPKSVSVKNNFEYLLSYGTKIPNGTYNLKSIGLKDYYDSPVDSNSVIFLINQIDTALFYLKSASLVSQNRIKVEFNLDADSISALKRENYELKPFDFIITSVSRDESNKKTFYLNVGGRGTIGSSGKDYFLKIINVYSENGIKIVEGAGSILGFSFCSENLDNVTVYPNPYSINSGQNHITFANLTKTAKIFIYDLTGKFLREIVESDGNGGVEWDLRDNNGNSVPSGIYLFRAEGKDSNGNDVNEKIGKFAIVR